MFLTKTCCRKITHAKWVLWCLARVGGFSQWASLKLPQDLQTALLMRRSSLSPLRIPHPPRLPSALWPLSQISGLRLLAPSHSRCACHRGLFICCPQYCKVDEGTLPLKSCLQFGSALTCLEGLHIRWGGPVNPSFCWFSLLLLQLFIISSWETLESKVK